MDAQGIIYIIVIAGFFAVFAVIVWRTYRKGSRDKMEAPKYRMLDED